MKVNKDELDQLEEAIKHLRIAYEKYFAGVERLMPGKERDRIKAWVRRLRTTPTANTALKFRVQSLQATLVTHENYWDRICRQIEEGTYKRDRLRVRRQQASALPEAGPTEAAAPQTTPAADPSPRASGRPAPQKVSAAVKTLHDALVSAQRKAGVATPTSIDALNRTVAKQTRALREKYGARSVEFRVSLKDGKPILKAIPKK